MGGVQDPPEKLSDRELVRRVQQGDRAAFDALYARFHERLRRFVFGFVGSASAEDVLQEAFYRCFSRAAQYNPRWEVSTWLYTIARNASYEELRRRRRHPSVPLPEHVERLVRLRGTDDPAERAVAEDTAGRMREIIFRLPEREREVFLLRHDRGMGSEEVARVCRCSVRTVRNRMEKALLFVAREAERLGLLEES
jgi:RNA polymerase sigma-70 factor (ECF subfamily)